MPLIADYKKIDKAHIVEWHPVASSPTPEKLPILTHERMRTLSQAPDVDSLDKIKLNGVVYRAKYTADAVALTHLALSIGIPNFTKKNIEEVFRRIYAVEKAYGAMRTGYDAKDLYFTFDEVEAFVGLETNAGTKTKRQFYADIHRRLEWAADLKIRQTQSKREKAANEQARS